MIWPVIVYGGMVIALVGAIIVVSYLLGERRQGLGKDHPYESGIEPTTSARVRFGAMYYMVAIFFLIFDVEVALIFAWALALKEVGWAGYAGALLFIITLAVGLLYIWKLGGLDWSPDNKKMGGREDG